MIKSTVVPKETLVELLHFLAENARFSSVTNHISDSFTVEEVRGALRELARELLRELAEEKPTAEEAKKNVRLSPKTKELFSYLSPTEEKTLLTAFGFMEK